MSNWLVKQKSDVLTSLLRRTKTPMLATMPDGEILWCNEAFENFSGYTAPELVGKKTWIELTNQDEDLEYDLELVESVRVGVRTDYQLQKTYVTKQGYHRQCIIDVIRYPIQGELECFLVVASPLDLGVEFAVTQIGEIRTLILEMMQHKRTGLTFEKAMEWSERHPYVSTFLLVLFLSLILGDRVIELAKSFGLNVE